MSDDDARRIGSLDSSDYATLVEAYRVVANRGQLSPELRRVLVDTISVMMDREIATLLDLRTRGQPSDREPDRVDPCRVLRLRAQRRATDGP